MIVGLHFYSVFTRGHNSEFTTSTVEDSFDSILSDITITPPEVYEVLSSLDPTKAMGPDGINPKVLNTKYAFHFPHCKYSALKYDSMHKKYSQGQDMAIVPCDLRRSATTL